MNTLKEDLQERIYESRVLLVINFSFSDNWTLSVLNFHNKIKLMLSNIQFGPSY